MEINGKEIRIKISSLLNKAQKGEDVIIIRRGKKVARLVPVGNPDRRLPDLRKFRDSISVKGGALSEAVIQGRSGDRW